MPKKIFNFGTHFLQNIEEISNINLDVTSKQTLLEADIIVVEPHLPSHNSSGFLKTKKRHHESNLLDRNDTELLRGWVRHWKSEFESVCEHGKTIVTLLSPYRKFYVQSSDMYSISEAIGDYPAISNYDIFPFDIPDIDNKSGKEIKLHPQSNLISSYWKEFEEFSSYQVVFDALNFDEVLLITKTGDSPVGAATTYSNGNIILLPHLFMDPFGVPSDKREQLCRRFIQLIVELDKTVKSNKQLTPPPAWVSDETFSLQREKQLDIEISETNIQVEYLQAKLADLNDERTDVIKLKRLLYEQGYELEDAILDALRILGFEAKQFNDGKSEFDAVFVSEEGRFLGEAEGKDNKPINVDKIRQLTTNLEEDYARDEVEEYARGVLFGNAYRLSSLDKRNDFFTQKCQNIAKRHDIALVKTPDLFFIAKYLLEHQNLAFAKKCREAIHNTKGEVVEFPPISNDTENS